MGVRRLAGRVWAFSQVLGLVSRDLSPNTCRQRLHPKVLGSVGGGGWSPGRGFLQQEITGRILEVLKV